MEFNGVMKTNMQVILFAYRHPLKLLCCTCTNIVLSLNLIFGLIENITG